MNTSNNRVQLTGNLGKDPEFKTLDKGNRLAKFSMATSESYKSRTGEQSEDVQWHNITCWGQVAEQVENAGLKKGSFVTVEGKIRNSVYTDKNGQKRYFTEIVAVEVTAKQKAVAA